MAVIDDISECDFACVYTLLKTEIKMNSRLFRKICITLFGSTLMMLGLNAFAASNKACSNSNFRDFYDEIQHSGAGQPAWIRYDKTPENYSAFFQHCYNNTTTGGCFHYYGNRFKIVATSGVTTQWSAAVCSRVRHNRYYYNYDHTINLVGQNEFYAGPELSFQYKNSNGQWAFLTSSSGGLASFEIQQPGVKWYRWKWTSSTPRQYRIVVERAMKFDEFDFIMDW